MSPVRSRDANTPARAHRGRRIGRAVETDGRPRERGGFTILELLTTMGVISTLAALILPAVGTAREAARRIQCVNQLKQVGIALHDYHEQHAWLPAAWQFEPTGNSAYGWSVALLPFLEEQSLYRAVDRNRALDDVANDAARSSAPVLLLCPSDIRSATFRFFSQPDTSGEHAVLFDLPTANYVGVYGTFEPDDVVPAPIGDGAFRGTEPISLSQFSRGLSNTLLVGERTMARVPSTWLGVDFRGEDAACRIVGIAHSHPNCNDCDECEFDSRHSGGANFLWGDGHVTLVSETIDSVEYRRLSQLAAE